MWPWIERVLDIVAPRKDRDINVAQYSTADLTADPVSNRVDSIEIISLTSYKTGAVEDCIRALKYDGNARAASLLAHLLAGYLREELSLERLLMPHEVALVPMPLHPRRAAARGFNQIERILDALPSELYDGTVAHVARDVLVRTRDTPSQTRLPRHERLQNVAGAFALARPLLDTHVYLIDDVSTTGATLAAAAAPLLAAGTPTTCIALARA